MTRVNSYSRGSLNWHFLYVSSNTQQFPNLSTQWHFFTTSIVNTNLAKLNSINQLRTKISFELEKKIIKFNNLLKMSNYSSTLRVHVRRILRKFAINLLQFKQEAYAYCEAVISKYSQMTILFLKPHMQMWRYISLLDHPCIRRGHKSLHARTLYKHRESFNPVAKVKWLSRERIQTCGTINIKIITNTIFCMIHKLLQNLFLSYSLIMYNYI